MSIASSGATSPPTCRCRQPPSTNWSINLKTAKALGLDSAADAARPRRRGDRVSNCVVGSGGSRLPRGIIAEHGVEGSDHFSHDGDDDDLGFLVGVGETIGEGLRAGLYRLALRAAM